MAARLAADPAQADAIRQRLIECVRVSLWSEAELLRLLAMQFADTMPGLEAFVVDDTGFPRRACTRWACIGSTPGRWAARRIVRSRPAFTSRASAAAVA